MYIIIFYNLLNFTLYLNKIRATAPCRKIFLWCDALASQNLRLFDCRNAMPLHFADEGRVIYAQNLSSLPGSATLVVGMD